MIEPRMAGAPALAITIEVASPSLYPGLYYYWGQTLMNLGGMVAPGNSSWKGPSQP